MFALFLVVFSVQVYADSKINLYIGEEEPQKIMMGGRVREFSVDLIEGKLVGLRINNGNTVIYSLKKGQKVLLDDDLLLSIKLVRIDLTRQGRKALFELESKPVADPKSNLDYKYEFVSDTPAVVIDFKLGETRRIRTGPFIYKITFEHADVLWSVIEVRDVIDLEGFRESFKSREAKRYIFNGDFLWFRPVELKPTEQGYFLRLWIDSEKYFIEVEDEDEPEIEDNGVRYIDEVRVEQILSYQKKQEDVMNAKLESEANRKAESTGSEIVYEIDNSNTKNTDISRINSEDKIKKTKNEFPGANADESGGIGIITGASIGEYGCSGCKFGDKCYSIGTRTNYGGRRIFCGTDGGMYDQHAEGSLCENHFECSSNLCSGMHCTTKKTFWQRFFGFFGID